MPDSVEYVEADPRGRKDDRGNWTGTATSERPKISVDSSEPASSHITHRTVVIPGSHLVIHDVMQLRSPSPTPSPRSLSPSLVADDNSYEWTGTLSSIPNGNKYSDSFEKSNGMQPAFKGVDQVALATPVPISKTLPPHELHDIPEERVQKPRKPSGSKTSGDEQVLKLSAAEIEELTSAPESLPVTSPRRPSFSGPPTLSPSPALERKGSISEGSRHGSDDQNKDEHRKPGPIEGLKIDSNVDRWRGADNTPGSVLSKRPGFSARAISTPPVAVNRMSSYTKGIAGQTSPKRRPSSSGPRPDPLDLNNTRAVSNGGSKSLGIEPPSPIPPSIPLPPMSIPTYLQLELSSSKPSPLYIYRSAASEYPYESSKIKFERLLNFLLVPPQLEQVLYFGSFACLDAWLYTFTILPLRFFKALVILCEWWGNVIASEVRFVGGFVYHGAGRMWNRQRDRRISVDSPTRSRSVSRVRRPTVSTTPSYKTQNGRIPDSLNGKAVTSEGLKAEMERKSRPGWGRRHRRTKSQPSSLSSNHKADLLQGAVIIFSCIILMKLDASRMYHSIRGQSAVKLYVIYNALEVSFLAATCSPIDTL